MYDELIKRLRDAAKMSEALAVLLPHSEGNATAKLYKEAADAIEDLENKLNLWRQDKISRWIPVTEWLPECDLGAEVGNIEWISCGMVHSGCFGRGGKYRDAYFRTWTDAGEGMDAKDADYWRAVTIPEPPKEDVSSDID